MLNGTRVPTGRGLIEHASDKFENGEVRSGSAFLWGAHQTGDGVNFAIFSRHATHVRLEFYRSPVMPYLRERLISTPKIIARATFGTSGCKGWLGPTLWLSRRWSLRSAKGPSLQPAQIAARSICNCVTAIANWEFGPARGFQSCKPMADLSFSPLDDAAAMPKCVFTHEHFNWEGDHPPRHSASKTVIYETHVRGCTIDRSSGVTHPGTYSGLGQKKFPTSATSG